MRKLLACVLIYAMICPLNLAAIDAATSGERNWTELVARGYVELLGDAATLAVTEKEAKAAKKEFEAEREQEKKRLDNQADAVKAEAKRLRGELKKLNAGASTDTPEQSAERKRLHCLIVVAERDVALLKLKQRDADVLYDNRVAKLDLLVKWPADSKKIAALKESGQARKRQFGNVEDIGIRDGFKGQEKDIAWGKDIIAEMKRMGVIPPEVDVEAQKNYNLALARHGEAEKSGETERIQFAADELVKARRSLVLAEALTDYMHRVAGRIGRNSDLKIPLQLYLVWDDDPNAFALPGGFVFVNTGLLYSVNERLKEKTGETRVFGAKSESELAGVLAHEIAHVTKRHARRLAKHMSIMDMIYQGTILAIMIIFSGGIGIGLYYLIQYGLAGIGILMTLEVLGVSRICEREADVLGAQYAWKAGYDPLGFTRMFDRMASEFGYVSHTSWFRTHPAFYERIHDTFAENIYLPPKADLVVDTQEYQLAVEAVKELRTARMAKLNAEEKDAPRLGEPKPDCTPQGMNCPAHQTTGGQVY